MGALAFEDALRQFDLAVGVLGDGDAATRARLQGLRSEALRGSERIPESLQALTLAVALATTQEAKDSFILQRCRMLLDLWRGPEALDDMEKLATRVREAGDPARELEVQRVVARLYYVMSLDHSGYAEKARDAYERTIELARAQGAKTILGAALDRHRVARRLLARVPRHRDGACEGSRCARRGDRRRGTPARRRERKVNVYGQTLEGSEALLARLVARRDPIRLNAHYFRMMWFTLGSGKPERCIEICNAGIELAYRIGDAAGAVPDHQGDGADGARPLRRRLGVAGRGDLRRGAPLRRRAAGAGADAVRDARGRLQAALARAPHVIAESHAVVRAWMLLWAGSALAGIAPLCSRATPRRWSGSRRWSPTPAMPPTVTGQAALALAHGDLDAARETLARIRLAIAAHTR